MDKEQRSDVMSVCTFLPQLAQTPVEQSQDKANDYGLDRLQNGWLERREGGRGKEKRDNKKSARKSIKTNMEDGAAMQRGSRTLSTPPSPGLHVPDDAEQLSIHGHVFISYWTATISSPPAYLVNPL